MVLVLKRAFNLHTSFPATCTMHKCIRSRAYFRERRVDYESTVFHFHVPVPQLCLCDVGGPCRILFFSPPFNGLWAIVSLSQWRFLWIAHLLHSWLCWSGYGGGDNSVYDGGGYPSSPCAVPYFWLVLLSCVLFQCSCLCGCHCHKVCQALTVLKQDRQVTAIHSWIAKTQQWLRQDTWLNGISIEVAEFLHYRAQSGPVCMHEFCEGF